MVSQDMIAVAVQDVEDLEAIMKDPDKIDTNGFQHRRNDRDPYKHLVRTANANTKAKASMLKLRH